MLHKTAEPIHKHSTITNKAVKPLLRTLSKTFIWLALCTVRIEAENSFPQPLQKSGQLLAILLVPVPSCNWLARIVKWHTVDIHTHTHTVANSLF